MRVTKDASGVMRLQLRIIHGTADEAAMTSHALCQLALEWVRRQMEEEDISLDTLNEKVWLHQGSRHVPCDTTQLWVVVHIVVQLWVVVRHKVFIAIACNSVTLLPKINSI